MIPKLSRRDLLVIAGLGGVGALLANWLRFTAPLAGDVSTNQAAQSALEHLSARSDGNPDGDVRVVAFNDFLCPICKITSPDLAEAVRADGNVRVEYKDVSLFGPVAEEAARIGLAMARQRKYSEYHHGLMKARSVTDRDLMRDIVERVGGSWQAVERDVQAHEPEFTAIMNEDALLAATLGIKGTPAFLIGGLLAHGRLTADQFGELFEQARSLG